jgi:hypothetical protein
MGDSPELEQQARHFSFLIYPFRSSPRRACRGRDGRFSNWRHLSHRMEGEALARHLDDTFFFLPYIRDLLFPDVPAWPSMPKDVAAWRDKRLTLRANNILRQVARDALVRLTFDDSLLKRHNPFTLVVPGSDLKPLIFDIEWVDLFLFPLDVGFVVLKIATADAKIEISRVNDLLYHVSMLFAPSVDMQLASWRSAEGVELEGRHFVEFLLQGWTVSRSPTVTGLTEFTRAIRHRPASKQYTLGPDGETHGDRYRLFTFLSLPAREVENGSSAPFNSPWNRHLYEIATLTKLDNPTFYPSEAVVSEFGESTIARWLNWRAAALPEHLVFLAKSEKFTLNTLSHNVESDYLNLYLLSLFLKMRLSFFFADLVQRNPSLLRNLFAARRISKDFIRFQNEFWFPEVTHKPQGAYLYSRFQALLRNDALYSELNMQIQNLVSHLEQRYQFVIAILVAALAGPKTVKELGDAVVWLVHVVRSLPELLQ